MGRIANILDLPLEQKFLIASMCLTVEFLSQLAFERGVTEEAVMEQSLEFVKNWSSSGSEISEAKINSFLIKVLDSYDFTF